MSDIKTKPETKEYLSGFDRTFGRKLVGGPYDGKRTQCTTLWYELPVGLFPVESIACYKRTGDVFLFSHEREMRRDK